MGYGRKATGELWAVLNAEGEIVYSRGGSSSTPKLMVYPTEGKAHMALRNAWTKQVLKESEVEVVKIWGKGRPE
jgi:hypothetical protein